MTGRFCGWVTDLIPLLGILPGYRKWPLPDPYPLLLGGSVTVTPIYPLGHPPIPILCHVLEMTPTSYPFPFTLTVFSLCLLPSSSTVILFYKSVFRMPLLIFATRWQCFKTPFPCFSAAEGGPLWTRNEGLFNPCKFPGIFATLATLVESV